MKMNSIYKIIINSPWPLMMSINFLCLSMNLMINMMNKNSVSSMSIILLTMLTLLTFFMWMNNSLNEKLMIGLKSNYNNMSLKHLIYTIMFSEGMFFMTFFYINFSFKYFNNNMFNFKYYLSMFKLSMLMSFLNLMILLSSSLTIMETINLNNNKSNKSIFMLKITVMLSLYFLFIQLMEYSTLNFNMSNSVFFSNFFLITLFHMMHVLAGTIIMIYIQFMKNKLLMMNKTKFKILCWYWHFVDLIWIFIFITFYM
uniref:cytochrome c oxidase subunit III n=1 Tax=Aclerda takahashii TaxID=2936620 RepID=UPI002028C9D3|nr:cytochrome c oxidase subunit III [Aclerda takahashii]UPO69097.1 cytochrome c oxidase subunit 3 [Aclerda takahashii]